MFGREEGSRDGRCRGRQGLKEQGEAVERLPTPALLLIIIGFDYTPDVMVDIKFNSPPLARTVKLLARLPTLYWLVFRESQKQSPDSATRKTDAARGYRC